MAEGQNGGGKYNKCMKTTNSTPQNTTEQLEKRVSSLEKQNAELAAKIVWYEEQFRLSKQRQFGISSEKTPEGQLELPLFNEAEVCQNPGEEEPSYEEVTYERKKARRSRTDTMKDLPVETVSHTLPPGEQVCSCCNGALHEMKTEIRRELKVVPAEVKVVEHRRSVYACRSCERHGTEASLKYAPVPAPVFPKSMASPSAVAHILTQKFVQGLPFYVSVK
ncbi:Transposase C of IS166 homeodomain-containing protein [Evansella caseinilytica]|uniref:Transposase C of IS166 homeodomain-containing protein n=1 Tax=Evansella caseinilytica TaxID=1503961 RepID=A0A1H3V2U6_9BACI|nr:Transposase C of IS166 homeodomain-containing protein [Evansella caseinilytica]